MQMFHQVVEVQLLKNEATGTSKYYVIDYKSKSQIVQAFDCPTKPKMYIHDYNTWIGHKLMVIIQENDFEQ